jgi:glutaredoxin
MYVTVYTAPACPGCTATKRKLTALGIPFDEVPIDSDPNIVEAAKELGLTQAPIVCAEGGLNGDKWSHQWDGYRPDRIDALVA